MTTLSSAVSGSSASNSVTGTSWPKWNRLASVALERSALEAVGRQGHLFVALANFQDHRGQHRVCFRPEGQAIAKPGDGGNDAAPPAPPSPPSLPPKVAGASPGSAALAAGAGARLTAAGAWASTAVAAGLGSTAGLARRRSAAVVAAGCPRQRPWLWFCRHRCSRPKP